jgi:hypothetical protein
MNVTPTVLANFSLGLGFDNPGTTNAFSWNRNPEGVATDCAFVCISATPSGLRFQTKDISDPGVAKAQPFAEIRQQLRCKRINTFSAHSLKPAV